MKRKRQMSESIRLGSLLAVSGGFMDAYSYIERDHVFANAQTGNILLFGVNLSEGRGTEALHYLLPVLAFALGIALAELIHIRKPDLLHWRQILVLAEALIFVAVSFFPHSMNMPANALTSLACGIQVEAFRKIRGNGVATTMCIGNLRSGTQKFCEFLHKRDRSALKSAMLYYGIIICFVLGAVLGNFMVRVFHEKAILFSSLLLLLVFFMMFIDYERGQR